MKKRTGIIFIVLGILFLVNAIFGRAIVIPGYLETLTPGVAVPDIPMIRIIRYLVWAYSFKFGIYFLFWEFCLKTIKKEKKSYYFR
ncbi:MAG: hypothetical protein Ta2A_22890 [Treponemataceae bacterium]|nr:MAG: hypothetical protein Ta2A_22890 [Treponemataceae bacterium]